MAFGCLKILKSYWITLDNTHSVCFSWQFKSPSDVVMNIDLTPCSLNLWIEHNFGWMSNLLWCRCWRCSWPCRWVCCRCSGFSCSPQSLCSWRGNPQAGWEHRLATAVLSSPVTWRWDSKIILRIAIWRMMTKLKWSDNSKDLSF